MSKHVPELDGVRGLACLGVLFAHCLGGVMVNPPDAAAAVWRYSQYFLLGGVDLFFVLSGFLIGGILIDQRKAPNYFLAFWTRRAGRILPVLFILVASYIAILALRPYLNMPVLDAWLLKEPVHNPAWYMTFTQTIPMVLAGGMDGAGPRWMGITWSLAIEEQFYLIFPLVVYFVPPRYLKYLLIGLVLFSWLSRSGMHHYIGWYEAYISLPGRADCLALGALVAILVRSPQALAIAKTWRLLLDIAIVALGYLIAVWQFHWWSALLRDSHPLLSTAVFSLIYSTIALFFALCILRIFLYPNTWYSRALAWRPLTFIGLISYGLYMYHQAVNGLVHGLLFGGEPKVGSWEQLAASALVMAIAIGVATLSYVWIETPIRKAAQRVAYRPAGIALAAT